MGSIAEKTAEAELMPRFENGSINLQELVRRLAEDIRRRGALRRRAAAGGECGMNPPPEWIPQALDTGRVL